MLSSGRGGNSAAGRRSTAGPVRNVGVFRSGAVIVRGGSGGLRGRTKTIDSAHKRVIFASSLGTVFEWYDFYLYGALLAVISKKFFSGMNDTTAFMFALLAFAAGFFVRPFGALVFGRLGDLVGRKYTFLITIVIMGSSTALVGVLPSLRNHRRRRAHHPHPAATAAGPGAGR